MTQHPPTQTKAITLRVSPRLYRWLARHAAKNHRSLNKEVVAIIHAHQRTQTRSD